MSEYKKSNIQKTEYYTGNFGKVVKTKSDALLITVKVVSESDTFYENYIRVEKGLPLVRDAINKINSVTINPSFIKATEEESESYKSYLFAGKDGLYKNVKESMKKRGVL